MIKYLTALLCVVLVGLAQAADVEHLANGSFEAGSTPPATGWGTWGSVGDDWIFDSDAGADVLRTVGTVSGTPWWGRVADDANVFVALSNGASTSGWITQQLTPMVIGQIYDVNFSITQGPGETNPGTDLLEVYIGSTLVYSDAVGRWGWYAISEQYIANGADGVSPVLTILHENGDTVSHKMCIDTVSVFGPENTDPTPPVIDHVVNGSFEIGDDIEIQTGGIAYNADDDADHWTYVADPCDECSRYRVVGGGAPFAKTASDGTVYVALRNYGTGGAVQTSWLEQELLPLRIGQIYTVSWDVVLNPESDAGAVSEYAVMIGNTLIKREGVMRYGWYARSSSYTANTSDGIAPVIKLIHINSDGADHRMLFDNVRVDGLRNDHPDSCPGVILPGDLNEDCYIDMTDLGIFVAGWLSCNEPTNPNCWLQ